MSRAARYTRFASNDCFYAIQTRGKYKGRKVCVVGSYVDGTYRCITGYTMGKEMGTLAIYDRLLPTSLERVK